MSTTHVLQLSVLVSMFVGAAVAQQQLPAQQQTPVQQQAPVQKQAPTQQAPAQPQPPTQQYPAKQYPPPQNQHPPQYPYPPQNYYLQQVPPPKEPLVHGFFEGGYSETVGKTSDYLQGGYAVGAGFSVAPAAGSPVDFRFDVNYSRNGATNALLALSQTTNSSINEGNARIWSATLDLEFRIPIGGGVQAYFLGGGGAYNTRLAFRKPVFVNGGYYGGYFGGYYCDPFYGFCYGGYGEENVASHTVTKFGWNAGMGLNFPLENGASWFLEGRYNRIRVTNASIPIAYVPIMIGLRF